jgi:hypothetical protein
MPDLRFVRILESGAGNGGWPELDTVRRTIAQRPTSAKGQTEKN